MYVQQSARSEPCQFVAVDTRLKCTGGGASSGVQLKTTLIHGVSVLMGQRGFQFFTLYVDTPGV